MIEELAEDLKSDEGWVPHAYKDHLGYLTIGYGFLIDERKDAELPKTIAEAWLIHAIMERWNRFVSLEPWVQDQPEDVQRALGNMVYQMGVEGVRGVRGFKNTLRLLREGDRVAAAGNALNSKWARQTPARAKRVTDLMRGKL